MAKVSYERVGAAAVLTIERPERRNAVDPETADLLLDGLPLASRPTTRRASWSSPAPATRPSAPAPT